MRSIICTANILLLSDLFIVLVLRMAIVRIKVLVYFFIFFTKASNVALDTRISFKEGHLILLHEVSVVLIS